MDSSLALAVLGGAAAVAAALLVAALLAAALLVARWWRRRTRTAAARPAPRPLPASGRPVPREIWWATVPFEDGPGAKDRPCLVLRVRPRTALVAKITTRHRAERPGVLRLPPGSVGDRHGRASWLEPDELREVPLADFRRRVGPVGDQVWAEVVRRARH
ncbi:type II toxin-antitoxin system PemK/MazF family toxin [Kitasatospora sp. NPDC088346]|uniref:type II toxin-antitoxin system PemK/MazF family toxin n=1 Tax=Kitasatospora sp. NPDC088346 TaxID=3364073 RepID=UPI003829A8ED